MKKSTKKKIYGAVIGIIIILMISIFLFIHKEQKPHFKFLQGNAPSVFIEESEGQVKTHYVYSFEADSNDIIALARKELNNMDYKGLRSFFCDMFYSSLNDKNGYSTSVEIFKNYKLTGLSATYDNTLLNPFFHKELHDDGWITIRITKTKANNWLFYDIKYLLKKLRGSK